jgi:iron complex outermembrane receptor protein
MIDGEGKGFIRRFRRFTQIWIRKRVNQTRIIFSYWLWRVFFIKFFLLQKQHSKGKSFMKKIFCWVFTFFALSILVLAPSSAQVEMEIEKDITEDLGPLLFEVAEVTTATLSQTPVIKAPSTVSVITEEQIHEMNLRSLSDALKKVLGITLGRSHFGEELISLRGIHPLLSNDKFKFMIDGHAMLEPLWGHFEDVHQYSLENVKQIEIIRGPGSSLYGTNAFAGVINIITKKPSDINGTRVDVKRESFDTTRVDITTGKKDENFGVAFNANFLKTDGPGNDLERDALFGAPFSFAPGEMKEGFDRKSAKLNLEWNKFDLTFGYLKNDEDVPVPQAGFLTQNGEHKFWDYWYFVGKHAADLSDSIELRPTVYYDYIDYEDKTHVFPNGFVIPFDIDGDGDIEFFPNGASANFGYKAFDVGADVVLDWKTSDNNQLLLGVFAEKVETNDTFIKANGHPLFLFNVDQIVDFSETANFNEDASRDIKGFFFQDQWDFNEDWYLITGARYDDFSDFGNTFNPRGGLVWDFNKKGGVWKFLYGSAFKAPTFSQLRNQNNPVLVGNRDLDPETLDSYETTLSYIFAQKLHTNVSLYFLETEEQIEPSSRNLSLPGRPLQYANSGEVESKGVEFEAKYFFKEKNYFFGSFTFTDAEDNKSNKQLGLIPETTGTLGVNLHFLERWNWNTNAEFIGEIPRETGDARDDLDQTVTTDSTLRIEGIKGFDVYASVFNVFDEEVFSASPLIDGISDLPRAGTSYAVGATYKF